MAELEQQISAGYDAVYAAIPRSPALAAIWREHAMGRDFPPGFEHISFVTRDELTAMAGHLRLGPDSSFADVACGMGGPALWVARESGARVAGVDLSTMAIDAARTRAEALGLANRVSFSTGSFADTGLAAAAYDGVMSEDAIQYAGDKLAAFVEFARILKPGGRLVFVCFELDPARVAGVPVLGAHPVDDYTPLLEEAGFVVTSYAETPGWSNRLERAYGAIIDAREKLSGEMGETAYGALSAEVSMTLQLRPYRRRVLVAATRK
jgi:SAM-dependent methyltransferase